MMKKKSINLHMNPRRTLLTMVFFSLISFFVILFIGIAIKSDCSQFWALSKSKYEYSAVTKSSTGKDDYIQYTAGIYFATADDAQSSLNADVIMQSNETIYSNYVYWKAEMLEEREVAITKGMADSNKLNVGDKLFSKHIVDGSLQEYVIAEILSDSTVIRTSGQKSYTTGIIIMGFDSDYFENVTNNNLIFTDAAIEDLSEYYPENIIYRDDEIKLVIKQISPYIIIEILVCILLYVGLCIVLSRHVEKNFLRLLTLGFPKDSLNSSYCKYVCLAGVGSIAVALIVSVGAISLLHMSEMELLLVVGIGGIELLTIMMTASVLNKILWRR